VYGKRVDMALHERSGKPVCISCRAQRPARSDMAWSALRWLSSPQREDGPSTVATPPVREPGPARGVSRLSLSSGESRG